MSAPPSNLLQPQQPQHQANQLPSALGEHPAIAELRGFLTNAPRLWTSPSDPPVRKFKMANGEEISCVFWKGRFFITGTDVVKILIFRFQQLGRGILNPKKFEEGVFSDLRNLKPGTEAVLEEPRSEFLEFLHKHGCIRTQKKQKVFFWNKVPHDDLFREALERNLKRVATVVNWTQMMSNSDMAKQYMMLQAAANMGGAPTGTILSPGGSGAGLVPALAMLPQTTAISNGGCAGFPSPLMDPMQQLMMPPQTQPTVPPQMRHPRRTISMSAIDFTAKATPAGADGSGNNVLLAPAHTNVPEISSALSSPLFTGSPSLDIEIDEKYFDLPSASSDPPIMDPTSTATTLSTPMLTPSATSEAPNITISPTLLLDEEMAASTLSAGSNTAVTSSDAATSPSTPLDTFNNPNELCILDPTLGLDMPNDDLLSSPLWAGVGPAVASAPPDKSGLLSSGNNPLWDDLSMLMPNVAPNHPSE